MKIKRLLFITIPLIGLMGLATWAYKGGAEWDILILIHKPVVGQKIDSLNGVHVFYNGKMNNVAGRNTTSDGYNLGLKYQCVEFVKRYYYQHLHHKFPDGYGHAKDFFDKSLQDGQKNKRRNLTQYSNPSLSKPQEGDIVIFDGNILNMYGHVAIIAEVTDNSIVIIQQNPGPTARSRVSLSLRKRGGRWEIRNNRILGWLRKE